MLMQMNKLVVFIVSSLIFVMFVVWKFASNVMNVKTDPNVKNARVYIV